MSNKNQKNLLQLITAATLDEHQEKQLDNLWNLYENKTPKTVRSFFEQPKQTETVVIATPEPEEKPETVTGTVVSEEAPETAKTPYQRLVDNIDDARAISEDLVHAFNYFGSTLLHINPIILNYLDEQKKAALKKELKLAFYQLCARYEFTLALRRKQLLDGYAAQIEQCAKLIQALEGTSTPEKEKEEANRILEAAKQFAQWNTLKTAQFTYARGVISWANTWRLYWFWTSALLQSLVMLSYSAATDHVTKAITSFAHFYGWVSATIYFVRFLMDLSLFLKHVCLPSKEEKELLNWKERFYIQWQQRKFAMANDLAWAAVNIMGFFWLTNSISKTLGYWGNVITVALLICDLAINFWSIYERYVQHLKDLERLDNNIEELRSKLETDELSAEEKGGLYEHLHLLHNKKAQLQIDWKYKSRQMIFDAAYSIALLVSFVVMVGALTNITVPGAVFIVGSFLMFSSSFLHTSASAYNPVSKANALTKLKFEECLDLLESINKTELTANAQIAKHLAYQQAKADALNQAALTRYHRAEWIRTSITYLVMPSVIFGAFTGLGFGLPALGIVLACVLISGISSFAIESGYKPGNKAVEPNTETITEETLAEEEKETKALASRYGVFSKKPETTSVADNPIENQAEASEEPKKTDTKSLDTRFLGLPYPAVGL